MNLKTVKKITIPEGSVKRILIDGKKVWELPPALTQPVSWEASGIMNDTTIVISQGGNEVARQTGNGSGTLFINPNINLVNIVVSVTFNYGSRDYIRVNGKNISGVVGKSTVTIDWNQSTDGKLSSIVSYSEYD